MVLIESSSRRDRVWRARQARNREHKPRPGKLTCKVPCATTFEPTRRTQRTKGGVPHHSHAWLAVTTQGWSGLVCSGGRTLDRQDECRLTILANQNWNARFCPSYLSNTWCHQGRQNSRRTDVIIAIHTTTTTTTTTSARSVSPQS